MMNNQFRKDVLADLAWEKDNINKQIELLAPMSKTLKRSAGIRFLSSSGYLLFQLLCWILALGSIVWLFFLYRVVPFFDLSMMLVTAKRVGGFTQPQIELVEWSIRGLVVVAIFLFIVLSIQFGKLRRNISLTHVAGSTIHDMKGKLEERMKKLNEFEEKYAYLLQEDINIELDDFVNPNLLDEHNKKDTLL